MNNIIADLPSLVSEKAMNAPTPHALKTGASHAGAIFNAYTDDSGESTKLSLMRSLACEKTLTYQEFEEQCRDAQKLADTVDQANGFVPEKGTKDISKRYGLKRRVLNQRLSEAKRLFGVFKQAPDILKEKGYQAALVSARQWLDENKVQWDGAIKLDREEKEAKVEHDAIALARTKAMIEHPQEKGEGFPAYVERIQSIVEKAAQEAQEALFTEKVQKLVDKLTKNEDGEVLAQACLSILEALPLDGLKEAIAYLQEAQTIAMLEAKE